MNCELVLFIITEVYGVGEVSLRRMVFMAENIEIPYYHQFIKELLKKKRMVEATWIKKYLSILTVIISQ